MKKTKQIMGQAAAAPRMTKAAALLVAIGLSVPVFLLLTLLEAVVF
ncbi:hypothetical protein K3722_10400 [Leisingera caerulea]|uniref:Uncharacterized protein n=1 Tax=Leisingera caerulea TaxID=506591 RepID=A0ABY5WS01_LEICA|nr:hypothetical protein [Leisingera caerulea]UWQ48326.1 hypothetical protein K3720_10215 [Leisingera caerulea]UWQ56958.1 hypothetical protein K3722_10400 [Leisingera caerulea]UWQ61235.1 hypothetical protein K3723_10060 [Leisingera caerulea]UWQ82098.1 hypothetical protein K3726_10250 [Leisingera caerulea]